MKQVIAIQISIVMLAVLLQLKEFLFS